MLENAIQESHVKNFDLVWAREHAGLTQAKAAKLIGVSTRTFIRWETGATRIPERQFNAFLRAADIQREEIPRTAPTAVVETAPREERPDDGFSEGLRNEWESMAPLLSLPLSLGQYAALLEVARAHREGADKDTRWALGRAINLSPWPLTHAIRESWAWGRPVSEEGFPVGAACLVWLSLGKDAPSLEMLAARFQTEQERIEREWVGMWAQYVRPDAAQRQMRALKAAIAVVREAATADLI